MLNIRQRVGEAFIAIGGLILVQHPDAKTGGLGRPYTARTGGPGGGIACGWNDMPTKYMAFRSVGLIAAGAQATIVQEPQERFKAARVVVPSSLGLAFTVDAMSVGTSEQNVDPGTGVLAQVMSEASGGCEVCFEKVCEPGIRARMVVTNITGVPQTFFAMWTGIAERACG